MGRIVPWGDAWGGPWAGAVPLARWASTKCPVGVCLGPGVTADQLAVAYSDIIS